MLVLSLNRNICLIIIKYVSNHFYSNLHYFSSLLLSIYNLNQIKLNSFKYQSYQFFLIPRFTESNEILYQKSYVKIVIIKLITKSTKIPLKLYHNPQKTFIIYFRTEMETREEEEPVSRIVLINRERINIFLNERETRIQDNQRGGGKKREPVAFFRSGSRIF